MFLRRPIAVCICLAAAACAAQPLPPEVDAALARAKLPRDALVAMVVAADAKSTPRVSHRAQVAINPASIAKLATTFAALEMLGPAYTWSTPVYVDGPIQDGVLQGNLYIKGQGDPKLVAERLWLLLRRVQGLGIRSIAGDIVLDHSAFEVPPQDPGAFDGEPLRPYNASPDALLLNFKSVVMTFTPLGANAQVQVEPPLAAVQFPASVPLSRAPCGDWRAALQPDFSDPARVRFAGSYPAACGERFWPLAYADPRSYGPRAIAGMWQHVGGALKGQVRDGPVPAGLAPAFELQSPPLADVVRDINKFSNNVMAQQVFLTLALAQGTSPATPDAARQVMQRWWRERIGPDDVPVFDSGSGLSRQERISALQLARLLQLAWSSPLMPELVASLPLAGVDGTLRRGRVKAGLGVAHLKTGSLRDSAGVAGYVDGASGRRYVLVAIVNHPQAAAARAAIDALVEWTARDE
ncbi:D-alanyl-D-alanine carboxypeptidase/D-alanyl-D-alanine endopeptidase [Ramlibacter tataouinensis]|uniref:D-alanyl-D-alanine carboxypeptidase/D-alanyl-D-alanine endopeptidase n=1 Tax=Ramlibacter tataouinensis TaxID=94132 RepID=UPI000AD1F466|nr:D-alanyl-D-alanine carboxypeptidase/D-alanyl-D-alanine-endopeptidase [Ramlibacter tataouinensis]